MNVLLHSLHARLPASLHECLLITRATGFKSLVFLNVLAFGGLDNEQRHKSRKKKDPVTFVRLTRFKIISTHKACRVLG